MNLPGNDAGGCGTLASAGAYVQGTRVAQDPPAATGGSLESGTYDLTSYAVYTGTGGVAGPSTKSHRASFRFNITSATEGTVELVDSQEGGTTTDICGSVSISGTALTINASYPLGAPVITANYSATVTQIEYQVVLSDGSTLVYVLEKSVAGP